MTELIIDQVNDTLVIRVLLERATLSKAGLFRDTIATKIEEGFTKFIVDCSNIEFMDSTFLGAMVVSLKKLNALNGNMLLVLSGKSSPIWSMFETTRMFKVFKCYLSLEEAIESFNSSE